MAPRFSTEGPEVYAVTRIATTLRMRDSRADERREYDDYGKRTGKKGSPTARPYPTLPDRSTVEIMDDSSLDKRLA